MQYSIYNFLIKNNSKKLSNMLSLEIDQTNKPHSKP